MIKLRDTRLGIGFASSAMSVFADMIMVQLLAVIVTLGIILVTGTSSLSSDNVAYLVAGLFGSFLMLGSIYSRISQV